MSENQINKIVLIGAGGNAGSAILKALLAKGSFDITVLTRPESQSDIPDIVKVVRGSYEDPDVLSQAFSGADALIITLGFRAISAESKLIEGAIKAGIKWIVPNEYAGDGTNVELVKQVPAYQPKQAARQLIERLGGKYFAVSTGPWTEFSIKHGGFRIDVPKKTVTLPSGTGRFNTSTLQQLGKGVAALLSLPIDNKQDPARSLSHYANSFVYISSLYTTQPELFEAVKRATNTKDEDWTIEPDDLQAAIEKADKALAGGDFSGMLVNLYYRYMGEGLGGDVEKKSAKDREVLGLELEDIDVIARRAVEGLW